MNITSRLSQNAKMNLGVNRDKGRSFDYTNLGKKGQIITGTITSVKDRVSIDFDGTEVKVDKHAVKDPKTGEQRKFQIMDVSMDGIRLKEIKDRDICDKKATGMVRTVVDKECNNITEIMEQSGLASEDSGESQAPLQNIENRVSEQDREDLESEGISLEKYDLERLDRALARIKQQRLAKEQGIENTVENQKEQQMNIKKMAAGTVLDKAKQEGADTVGKAQIMARLQAADLPVTFDNIASVERAMSMADVAPDLNEPGMKYLLQRELEPTIGNVYHAQYAGSSQRFLAHQPQKMTGYLTSAVVCDAVEAKASSEQLEQAWLEVAPQAEDMLQSAGISVDSDTMERAKWLFAQDLPITRETILQFGQLEQVKEQYDREEILARVVMAISKGETPESVSLIPSEFSAAQKSIQAFLDQIEQEIIIIDASLQEQAREGFLPATQEKELGSSLTKKRQLEEVRLKMTADVADQMARKGISLDVERIEEIVDELRNIERNYYRGILAEGQVVDTDENVDLLQHTMETVEQLRNQPADSLGSTLERAKGITLEELQREGEVWKNRLVSIADSDLEIRFGKSQAEKSTEENIAVAGKGEGVVEYDTIQPKDSGTAQKQTQAQQAYNTMMTRPDRELGDHIQKAFRNVEAILEDMKMEPTQANIRAVKILAHNQMPITEENIYNVKNYDAQVNRVLDNLHPAVTVELIKRKINPLQMPLPELDQQITGIKEEMGVTGEEKYSKFLYELEQSHKITPEDRSTYINMYRLLNNIQKFDGAAVGYVLQSEREMNFENLMTAVRTLKSGGVEEVVADSQDVRDIVYSRSTLLTELNQSFAKKNTVDDGKKEYYQQVTDAIAEEISPSAMQRLTTDTDGQRQDFAGLWQQDVEKVLENIRNAKTAENQQQTEEIREEKIQQQEQWIKNLKEIVDNSDRTQAYLSKYELPATVENLVAASHLGEHMKQLQEKSRRLTKTEREEMLEAMDGIADGLEDAKTMEIQYTKLADKVEELLDARVADPQIASMELQELRNLTSGIGLIRQLARREDYQVPVVVGDSVTNMHVTILPNSQQKGRVEISVDSDRLGKVEAEFYVDENQVEGQVNCLSKKAADSLQERLEDYARELKKQGMALGSVIYTLKKKSTDANDANREDTIASQEKQDTRNLYKAAKAFVSHISMLERETEY